MQRRERTRNLIELGGLVQKAGLADLADDDRATIYGALLELVGRAKGDAREDTLMLWKRRGRRAFETDATSMTPARADRPERSSPIASAKIHHSAMPEER